ncbi:hypothetical protein [Poriferisphaera sp. WC338]|uniref:hypothetical protein n=1 Tax=Poriferisphaera sp. WC338 TaxID=3425129 RepID=UPI003D8180F8
MGAIDRVLKRVSRRLFLQRWIDWLATMLLLGVLLAAVMLLLQHLLLWVVPMLVYGVLGGLVLVLSLFFAWSRRLGKNEIAKQVDDKLALKDMISTAVYAKRQDDHPFAGKVIADAEQVASEVSALGPAFKLRLGSRWLHVVGGVLLVAGLGLYLSIYQPDPFGMRANQKQIAAKKQSEKQSIKHLQEAEVVLQKVDTKNVTRQASLQQVNHQLASLSRKRIQSDAEREEALEQLARMREQVIEQKKQEEEELKWVRNTMSRLETTERGPADDMIDAMRRGDFKEASKELNRLSNQINQDQMSKQQKTQLQKQLKELSEQLNQAAEKQDELAEQSEQAIKDALKDAGLNDAQINDLQKKQFNPQQVKEALQQKGIDPQQANDVNKQVQQQQQNQQTHQNQQRTSGGLSQAMQQMANALPKQPQPAAPNQSPGTPPQPKPANQQSSPSQPQNAQPQQTPSQQPGQQSSQQQNQQQGQQGSQPGQQQGANQQSGQQQGQQPGQQSQSGQQSGQSSSGDSSSESQFSQGADAAQQHFGQLGQKQQQANQMQSAQSQMQQAMQQLEQSGSGGQDENDPANQQNQTSGSSSGQESGGHPLGASRNSGKIQSQRVEHLQEGEDGRQIVSWEKEGPVYAGEPGVSVSMETSEAVEHAEQAVSENRVPRRYHKTLHQYYGQSNDDTGKLQGAPAAPE